MRGIFINESDEITINITLGVTAKGFVVASSSQDEFNTLFMGSVLPESVGTYEVVFRRPTFSDTVHLNKSMFNTVDGVSVDFNPWEMRFNRVGHLIKRWTLPGDDGSVMPVSKESVAKLHPNIATVIGAALDAELGSF